MPITRKQFDLGIDEDIQRWMRRVYPFLEKRREEAYSKTELIREWPELDRDGTEMALFDHALDALVRVGAFESRWVGKTTYYLHREEVDMGTWERPAIEV